jgi:hypothetical protein
MARTALVYDRKSFSGSPLGSKEDTRTLMRRALDTAQRELGESGAWRLFQLAVAASEYRFGRYEAAAALANHAMMPREQIPLVEAAGLSLAR